ncbi:cyclase [Kordiimonas sediminis]|uniref:beta-lactamase n=1 Tax=Kordiimonas sediminis TaxID=1735581 RepID=A0A919ALW3_9PROT|nr:MBL fold metallo-hydrolase [Kordiimonas sediminis]GHF15832.1 cyclase [Kordiimonas sediminis]
MKLKLAVAAALLSTSVSAQDWDKVEIRTEPVRNGIHVLYGAGGNIGVSVGEDGVYIIDDQYAPLSEKISAAIATLSDKPVRFVINTHYHGDHTGGNEYFGKAGAVVVAHDNIRLRLEQGSFLKVFNMKTPPQTGAALPIVTFNDEMSLHLNGDEARIIHVKNAHTDGDSVVYFKKANVFHMGDTLFADRLPFIDVDGGGSIDGVIAAAKKVIGMADDDTVIIAGHGPNLNKSQLQAYHDMLVSVRNEISGLKASGLSLEDIVAQRPLDDLEAGWLSAGAEWTDLFIGFVYSSLPTS